MTNCREVILLYEGGIEAYVKYLDKSKNSLHQTVSVNSSDKNSGISLELAMQWNDSYHENILCFTNNIRQRDGGTHLVGMKAALTRTINNYASDNKLFKKEKIADLILLIQKAKRAEDVEILALAKPDSEKVQEVAKTKLLEFK